MNHVATPPQPLHKSTHRHMGRRALTSGFEPSATGASRLAYPFMHLLDRDHRVLTLFAHFGQLSTPQVNALVFWENRSRTPCNVTLRRLVKAGFLEPVQQPHPGGRLGGSSVNVYQLGKQGWGLFFEGRRMFGTVIKYHSLAIADVFVAVKQAEQAGWLDVLEWQSEPDSWVNVAGSDLRPDLFLDIGIRHKRERLSLFLEIDLGGERQKQIVDKLERYIYAYNHAESYPRNVFPEIKFLCTTDDRKRELEHIIKRTPNLADGLVTVELLTNFPQSLR